MWKENVKHVPESIIPPTLLSHARMKHGDTTKDMHSKEKLKNHDPVVDSILRIALLRKEIDELKLRLDKAETKLATLEKIHNA